MKKFYMIAAAALVAMSASAESLKFVRGEERTVVGPGQTIVCNNWTFDDMTGELMMNPELYVLSDETATVRCVVKSVTGQDFQCCMGGECAVASKDRDLEKEGNVTANVPFDTKFEYVSRTAEDISEIDKDMIAQLTLSYTFFGAQPTEPVTVIFNQSEGGTNQVFDKGETLVSVDGSLEYNIEGAAQFRLFDTKGNVVIKQDVNGNGSISTASLDKGVYVYTLGTRSGKVFVK